MYPGDLVRIKNNGQSFTTYIELAETFGMKSYCSGYCAPNGPEGELIKMQEQFNTFKSHYEKICWVRFEKEHLLSFQHKGPFCDNYHYTILAEKKPWTWVDYLITSRGLKVIQEVMHLPDDLFNINI